MRLAILVCAYTLAVTATDPANSPAVSEPVDNAQVIKPPSVPAAPKSESVPSAPSGPSLAKSASGPSVAKPASDPTVPKPSSVPAVPKPASASTAPKTASGPSVAKPASDSTVPKTASSSSVPKPTGSSVTNSAEPGKSSRTDTPSTSFQPTFSSKPLEILGFLPYNGYSNFVMWKALMSGLAKRGHRVTVVSSFPLKTPEANYTDIDLSDVFPKGTHIATFNELVRNFDSGPYARLNRIMKYGGPEKCKQVFNHPKVKALLSSGRKFDVIFTEVFATDCYLALGHLLQAPVINLVSSDTLNWMSDYVGDSSHPAVVANHFNPRSYRDLSNFGDRFGNVLCQISSKIFYYFLSTLPSEKLVREIFGNDVPSLTDLRHNVSLVMVNTHPAIFGAQPTVPRILPIGGIHLQSIDNQDVSESIKLWLDTAPLGVLLFSFGSLVSPESIPPRLINAFVSAFYDLRPLRVLWKYKPPNDTDERAELPENVKAVDWLPQVQVLGHPNTVAFITHGGAMGIFEALYYAVPMIGIPLFADQLVNILRVQKIGCATHLDHATLTKEDVVKAVLQATSNSTVRQRVKEVSTRFRDQPTSPLDSAIWWTEYVVRHGGAPHLESLTAKLPFWQYALLDVTAAFLAIIVPILYFIHFLIRYILRFRRRITLMKSTVPGNKKEV